MRLWDWFPTAKLLKIGHPHKSKNEVVHLTVQMYDFNKNSQDNAKYK